MRKPNHFVIVLNLGELVSLHGAKQVPIGCASWIATIIACRAAAS